MTVPLACDITAIPPADRGEHQRVTRQLVACATDMQGTSDGIAFQLPAEEYDAAARFIALERLCCPFLRFALEVSPGRGPLWLRLDGPPGSGGFIRSELQLS